MTEEEHDAPDLAGNEGYAGYNGRLAPDVPRRAMHPASHRADVAYERMLTDLQRESFGYFLHEVNERNGLVADKTSRDWPCSIAAIGMALTVYPIGAQRALMTHEQALQRTLVTLRFLMAGEQSEAPTAMGHRGFFYHFLDMETGRRAWQCELSSIDTALLMGGVLAAAAYFRAPTPGETEVRALAAALYERVEWDWLVGESGTICHGWKPETGLLPYYWDGYDEALLLYLLALGSPTHAIAPSSYAAWCATHEWKTVEGLTYLHAGPLFVHQMSYLWIDARALRDDFMRAHDSDYFRNSRIGVQVQQRYAMRNPLRHAMYGEFCWGITASDGPGATHWRQPPSPPFLDYVARGVPDGPDDGTLAPWAVVASLPFAPEIVLPTIANYRRIQLHTANPYGFKASFNPSFPADRKHSVGWVSPYHFGINEGPTVVMMENHRSGLIWNLMRSCVPLVAGLRRAGFAGGWLGDIPHDAPCAPPCELPVPPDGSAGEVGGR